MKTVTRRAQTLFFGLALAAAFAPAAPASATQSADQLAEQEDRAGGTCRIWCVTHNVHELIAC